MASTEQVVGTLRKAGFVAAKFGRRERRAGFRVMDLRGMHCGPVSVGVSFWTPEPYADAARALVVLLDAGFDAKIDDPRTGVVKVR